MDPSLKWVAARGFESKGAQQSEHSAPYTFGHDASAKRMEATPGTR